jgi:ribosomal protein S18 acetylase RimI-like enzyme
MRRPSCFVIVFFLSFSSRVKALIISHPRSKSEFAPAESSANEVVSQIIPLSLRIRSTREEDIPRICDLLASSEICREKSDLFGVSIAKMRLSASFHSLLTQRFQAWQKGRSVMSEVAKLCQDLEVEDYDRVNTLEANKLRMIWDNDSFRCYLQKAALLSNEPHLWKDHNFYLCPSDTSLFQHMMVTAEDKRSGSIVGFCEVAMLLPPFGSDLTHAVPTIGNLIISRQYRRKGIASRLLATATAYVAQFWNQSLSDEIGLYVASNNKSAISLYQKHGFQLRHPVDSCQEKWYFTKNIHDMVHQ